METCGAVGWFCACVFCSLHTQRAETQMEDSSGRVKSLLYITYILIKKITLGGRWEKNRIPDLACISFVCLGVLL